MAFAPYGNIQSVKVVRDKGGRFNPLSMSISDSALVLLFGLNCLPEIPYVSIPGHKRLGLQL